MPVRVGLVWVTHKGIVSDRWHIGEPLVINRSKKRGVTMEEPWSAFADGQPVKVLRVPPPGRECPIVLRARSQVGSSWSLLAQNCEHLTTYAWGESPRSDQINRMLGAAVMLGLVFAVVSVTVLRA